MGADPKPSLNENAGSQPNASTAAPAPVTENQGESPAAHLITFQPSAALRRQPSLSRDAAAAAAERFDRRLKIRRRYRLLTLITGVLACLSVILVWGPKAYHQYKIQRAIELAHQGEDMIRKNQIEQAVPYIRSAYILSPKTPEVLRAMARLLTDFSSPEATNYWTWLLQTGAATDNDRRDAVECAMQYNLYDEASALIKDLLARNGGDARNQLLAARWDVKRGTPAETMLHATRAVNDDPANKDAALFLADQELANPYLHQEGVDSLLHLVNGDDSVGLQALHSLALDPSLKPAELDRVIAQLQSYPLGGESERLDALILAIKRHPEQREILIDRAVAAHQNATPDDLATFCEWLTYNNEVPRVLKLITRDKALSNKTLCFAYLDALAACKRWDDIKNLLTGATVPIEVPLIELFLSRCASETGDQQASDLHWQNAVSSAEDDPAQTLRLAVYAENHGENKRAAAVYRALTQEPVAAFVAYQGLLRVSSDEDTRTVRDLLDEMRSHWPSDPEIGCKDIFFNLLLNEHVPEMHQRAVGLLDDDSHNLSLRTNVALACLRLNDPLGAIQAYDRAEIDWNTAPANDLVVYAATLNANGQGKAAHELLLPVNRHILRPEIRDLIKTIR